MSNIRIWQITPTEAISLDLSVSSLDEATRRLPEGYYSTFRTFGAGRRVLGLTAHLRRLYDPVPAAEVDDAALRRRLSALLEPYRPDEARVRAVMTAQGQLFLAISRLTPLPGEVYEKGVRVETTDLEREHPRLKSTTFIGRSDAERRHIAEEGIFEALLVKDGKILEGMTSNFFYVARLERAVANAPHSAQRVAALCTAQDNILLGVTRQTILDIAQGRGLHVRYEPLERDRVAGLSEAFITSSSRGIVPVVQIDDLPVGEGSPGPLTRELSAEYEAYVLEKAEPIV